MVCTEGEEENMAFEIHWLFSIIQMYIKRYLVCY